MNKTTPEDRQLSLPKCDVIKVTMMLAVIFYHCICLWSRNGWFNQPPSRQSAVLQFLCGWLNSFHVYVFAFVSGYLFFYLRYEKSKHETFSKYISNRSKRLLLPYIVTALVWVIPFYIFYFGKNPHTLIYRFALAIGPNQLWFLVMLFVASCMFYIFSNFFYKKNLLFGVFIALIFYGVGFLGRRFFPEVFQIWAACRYILFYYMGFAFRKYKDNILYKIPWIAYFAIDIATFAFYFYVTTVNDGIIFKLLTVTLEPLCSILGILMVVIGMSKFKYEKLQSTRLYRFLIKHNFVMYLFHQQLIYVTISLLNSKLPTALMVIVNFTFSCVISALIAVVLSKIPKVKNIFGYK